MLGPERAAVAHERAAVRPGSNDLMQGTSANPLLPGVEPHRPAVVPRAGPRAARDRDRVTGNRHVVVRLSVGRRHVDAAVADVREALLAHRPERVVQIVAAPREPDRERHFDVVAGADHVDRVRLLNREVVPVRGVVAGASAADRPVSKQLSVAVDVHEVACSAGHDGQLRADCEVLRERVVLRTPREPARPRSDGL